MDEGIKNKVMEHVKNTAWDAHPELLLQAMLVSDDFQVRDFAVTKIVEIRAKANTNTSGCPTPALLRVVVKSETFQHARNKLRCH